jgi:HAD superfamily hydrolase (TIGR01509 family)
MMALDLNRIRGLCFDVDGTLRDTDNDLVERVEACSRPLRLFLTQKHIQSLSRRVVMAIETPGNLLQTLLDRLGLDAYLDTLGNWFYRHEQASQTDHLQMIPRTRQMLVALHPNYQLAIVSARNERQTMVFLEKNDLTPFFSTIVTSQTCRYTKPHPDPILWAANQMGLPPEACVMIGDTTLDIRAGKAAMAQTVGVLCGFGQEIELRQSGADLILAETADLVKILFAKPLVA